MFEDRVRSCYWKVSSVKPLDGWKRLRIVNKGRTFSYKYFLDFEDKYGKISDCRTFSYFKTVSGCRTFSHFIAGTSASLRACVTILICCFEWTATSTTLSSASSYPRAGNFNWPLVLFNKDGKLQLLPRNLLNQWILLIPYRTITYSIVLNRIILRSSPNSSEKTQTTRQG